MRPGPPRRPTITRAIAAQAAPAAANASSTPARYSGSQTNGPTALPANLKAPTTEIAPPRVSGALCTASVVSPAQMNAEPAPAASQSAAITTTLPARPRAATIAAHVSAPMVTTGAGAE